MTNTPKTKKSRAAEFISRRLHELQGRKSQADVARIAGFKSANIVSMIAAGKAKLPIERAIALAKALECDPATLVRLTLEQNLSAPLIEQIFAGTSQQPKTPTLQDYQASAVALSVHVRIAIRELNNLKQFAKHVSLRAERVGTRLTGIQTELEHMAPGRDWLEPAEGYEK